ncbi:hypothetical protein [Thiohalocapsa halophila]|nr:hypothetical protein [Thiohalocapsa halophila]
MREQLQPGDGLEQVCQQRLVIVHKGFAGTDLFEQQPDQREPSCLDVSSQ